MNRPGEFLQFISFRVGLLSLMVMAGIVAASLT